MSKKQVFFSPSMMCADFLSLQTELDILKTEGVHYLHIDIMDGHYVPNYTLGTDIAKTLNEYSDITLDYHLMVEGADQAVPLFSKIPGSFVTFHPETSHHPVRTIQKIKDDGCKPGIAIGPATSLESVKYLLPLVDMVCIMTVNPGYSGQKLLPFCIGKMAELNKWKQQNHPDLLIEVDGNVSWENIPKMLEAGADVLVLGTSSVFTKSMDRKEAYKKLNDLIEKSL